MALAKDLGYDLVPVQGRSRFIFWYKYATVLIGIFGIDESVTIKMKLDDANYFCSSSLLTYRPFLIFRITPSDSIVAMI